VTSNACVPQPTRLGGGPELCQASLHVADELLMHREFLGTAIDAPCEQECLFTIRTRHELHIDALLGHHPVLLGELPLKLPQHRLGRADDVLRPALPQELEVVVADHPPIHDPDTVEGAMLAFQRFDDALHRQRIVHIACEDLIAQREAFFGDDQADADLRPVVT